MPYTYHTIILSFNTAEPSWAFLMTLDNFSNFCFFFNKLDRIKKATFVIDSESGDVWKISWNLNIVATRKNHYYVILAVLKIFVGGIHTCSHDFEISADFSDVSWFTESKFKETFVFIIKYLFISGMFIGFSMTGAISWILKYFKDYK